MIGRRVVTLGETMAVLRPSRIARLAEAGPFELAFGGSESNVAIGLARLGHQAAWVGCVGDDVLGRMIVDRLEAEGVQTDGVRIDKAASTGWMIHERRSALGTSVHYARAGSAGSRLGPHDIPELTADDHLHVTGITPALGPGPASAVDGAITAALDVGASISFDVNYRSALWSRADASAALTPIALRCSIVFASEDEIDLLSDHTDPLEAARSMARAGVTSPVLKQGARGATAVAIEPDGDVWFAAPSVPVVDPVGAGDAFVAGYLAAAIDGAPESDRVRQGSMASAFAVTVPGDFEGMPTRADLELVGGPIGVVIR